MSDFWVGKRVLVTGSDGFLGRYVIGALTLDKDVLPKDIVVVPRYGDCRFDLRRLEDCCIATRDCQVVIHLAAETGGISYSRSFPASQYRDCVMMDINMLEAARLTKVEKFVSIGNILAYPATAPNSLEEEYLHSGRVADTHLGIGTAKRSLVLACEMYHKEYGLNAVTVLSANAYGPGDRFDPNVAHVIPATIAKCHKDEPLVVWGDGKATRDFLYADDVSDGILLAAEKLNAPDYYVNLASGNEISIGDLVRMIARLCDFKHDIVFDESKGSGDPRRSASGKKAHELLEFAPKVGLEQGLRQTIGWYRLMLQDQKL